MESEVSESLLYYGLSGHAARDGGLGWLRDGSDGAILFLRLLLKVGYARNNRCMTTRQGSRRTRPDDVKGATMVRRLPFPLCSIPAYVNH